MKIIRVFPVKTSYTPDDDYCFFDTPPFQELIPEHDEIHICCVFTWDKPRAEFLYNAWQAVTDKPVLLDGPAYGNSGGEFIPGRYIKQGIIFTSRGCPNHCSWCFVPKREGALRELPVVEGNIIQDNNFLACSREHKDKVFEMLRTQKAINFKGGLEVGLIDDHFIENVKQLSIKELWLACDTDNAIHKLQEAAGRLTEAGFNRRKLRCYTMIGINGIEADEKRLRAVYEAGCMPFAQLYQPEQRKEYDPDYKKFARQWQRPAATVAHMEHGTSYNDFNT
jgi:hypothetical protein